MRVVLPVQVKCRFRRRLRAVVPDWILEDSGYGALAHSWQKPFRLKLVPYKLLKAIDAISASNRNCLDRVERLERVTFKLGRDLQ